MQCGRRVVESQLSTRIGFGHLARNGVSLIAHAAGLWIGVDKNVGSTQRNSSIFLPPLMVERNVLGSNLMSFLDAVTSVIIGPSPEFQVRRRLLPNDQGRMNAQEGREQRQFCGQKLGFHPTEIMISRFGVESQTVRGHDSLDTHSEPSGCRHSIFRSKPTCDNS